jgi:hypothetical protein
MGGICVIIYKVDKMKKLSKFMFKKLVAILMLLTLVPLLVTLETIFTKRKFTEIAKSTFESWKLFW